MKELEVRISNPLGLHARAAARFVHLANRFESRISVIKEHAEVDGKSILGLLTLAAGEGSTLRLRAEGRDAEQALVELQLLIKNGFGESGR
jgi:phosphocarrier protein